MITIRLPAKSIPLETVVYEPRSGEKYRLMSQIKLYDLLRDSAPIPMPLPVEIGKDCLVLYGDRHLKVIHGGQLLEVGFEDYDHAIVFLEGIRDDEEAR